MPSPEPTTYWYLFKQNESVGNFKVNNKVCPYVFVEAYSPTEANNFATETLGIIFEGNSKKVDPKRSGLDRWSRAETDISFPLTNYTPPIQTLSEYASYLAELRTIHSWTKPMVRIYHSDGTVESINKKELLPDAQ